MQKQIKNVMVSTLVGGVVSGAVAYVGAFFGNKTKEENTAEFLRATTKGAIMGFAGGIWTELDNQYFSPKPAAVEVIAPAVEVPEVAVEAVAS